MTYRCIKPQCPPNCQGCVCALPTEDDAAMLVCDLLDAFAVNGFEQSLEDGESQLVDRAREWLNNRPNNQGNSVAEGDPTLTVVLGKGECDDRTGV